MMRMLDGAVTGYTRCSRRWLASSMSSERLVISDGICFLASVAALSIGTSSTDQTPKRVWVAGAICSVIPDVM